MKNNILIREGISIQNTTHQKELLDTVNQYIEASKHQQNDILLNLLHPDARIYYANSLDNKSLVEHWKSPGPSMQKIDRKEWAEKMQMILLSLHLDHEIAHLKILVHTPLNYTYLDYHTLIWNERAWYFITKVSDLLETPSEKDDPPSGKECDEVLAHIQQYMETCFQLDFPAMRMLTHPDARIFIGGKKTSKNLHDHWKSEEIQLGKTPLSKRQPITQIYVTNIEVDKSLAFVSLQFGENWHNFHELIKIGENWTLINKVSQKFV